MGRFKMNASLLVCLAVCVCLVRSMTTTHMPHERPKYDGFSFNFDGTTQAMCVISGHKCYLWEITADEKSMVHTSDGLRNIEIRILKDIDGAFYTKVPKMILHPSIVFSCRRDAQEYLLVH